jgi:gliding motility-associated-like protein
MIRNYIHFTLFLMVMTCSVRHANAQDPSWSVNPSEYEFSMTVTAVLNADGALSIDKQDKVGAFIDGVCRGVASPSDFTAGDGNIVFLQVYSNSILGETVVFTLYDASAGVLVNASNSVTFQNDANIGTMASPYIITSNLDPTDISLSPGEIMEDMAVGSAAGIFSVTDPDGGDDADNVYTLINGAVDNAVFSINGDTLKSAAIFNHDEKSSYTVLVAVSDGKGGSFQKELPVQITVNPDRFTVNNYISPNGDQMNDFWAIKNITVYKEYKVIIYNDAGIEVLNTVGYNNDWSGTYQGKNLPEGVYYYVVQSPDGTKKFRGSISINR